MKSLLLLVDVVIAFSLCYFIIRFIAVGFSGRAGTRQDRLAPAKTESIMKKIIKILFGVSGEELFREERPLAGKKSQKDRWLPDIPDLLRIFIILLVATALGYLVDNLIASEAAVISVYMLAVLLIALGAECRLTAPIASVLCLLIYDFVFIKPRFIFVSYGREYSFIFILMCIVSVLTGTLTQRLKASAREAGSSARASRLLFETNQLMQQASDEQQILEAFANQLKRLLRHTVIIYQIRDGGLSDSRIFSLSDKVIADTGALSDNERLAADWAYRHNDFSGRGTSIYPESLCLNMPIAINDKVYGIASVPECDLFSGVDDSSIVISMLGECALAMENQENQRAKEAADVMARSERLRANLLRTLSHDLRTPLTSIYGNASNLLNNEAALTQEIKHQMYEDIYDDAIWLTGLVENLLSITRIEDKEMRLNIRDELVDEVIHEATRRFSRSSGDHEISIKSNDDFIFARMDAKLIIQVLINLISNAIKYTPAGSHIEVVVEKKENVVRLSVADDGPGIADEDKEKVFERFYTAGDSSEHGTRSIGLGLYLCRSIVEAHGSKLILSDNIPQGSVFSFELPAGEVDIHG